MEPTQQDAYAPTTIAVASGRPPRAPGAPLNEPVTLSSTYLAGGERTYGRGTNPGWEAYESTLGALEGGEALVLSSGVAAITAVLATLPVGAQVVVPQHSYAGTLDLLATLERRGVLGVRRVDATDPATLVTALPGAALVLVESPTNPTMEVIDLAATATAAHAVGARLVVDNTFATPLLQRPLDLGADVVVHSASKFLSGHSDVVLGAVVTRDADTLAAVRDERTRSGAIAGPFEVFLAHRGVRTLGVRMRQAQENAQTLAERLDAHPSVARVRYPGLPGDPGHAVARAQMHGFGAVLAFEHAGGAEAAEATCERTRLWTHATSLGGVESMIERRRRWDFEPETVPAALVRLSVGCEDVEDLWRDLAGSL